jgi:hypothetical protein
LLGGGRDKTARINSQAEFNDTEDQRQKDSDSKDEFHQFGSFFIPNEALQPPHLDPPTNIRQR